MLSFETSQTGDIVPVIEGRALMSRFNPLREAERFVRTGIEESLQPSDILIIVGDILGYFADAARKAYPRVRIISLSLHPKLIPEDRPEDKTHILWSPASASLNQVLSSSIDEEVLLRNKLAILKWQPSISAFPDIAAEVLDSIQRRVRILNGNITTIKAFGSRWIRNSILNYLYSQTFCRLTEARGPFLIAASGPSLIQSRDYILGSKACLMALPSSLCFLKNLGRIPDIIIQTDPGYFASLHLNEAKDMKVPIAAPLSASTRISRHPGSVLPLSCGEPFEESLWSLLEMEPVRIPAMGTVAASAIAFSLSLSRDPVVIAGLDLCYDDIHPHVHPHSFDPVFNAVSNREHPLYSVKYRHSRDTAVQQSQSPALKTYSDWFSSLPQEIRERIFRINPSRIHLPFPAADTHDIDMNNKMNHSKLLFQEAAAPSFKRKKERLLKLCTEIHGAVSKHSDSSLAREFRIKLCPPGIDADPVAYTAKKIMELQDFIACLESP